MREAETDLRRLAVPPEAWSQQIQQDRAFQESILPGVTPPFGLPLDALPAALQIPVANACLLYRLAMVLQHRVAACAEAKAPLYRALSAALTGESTATLPSEQLLRHLPEQASAAERELLRRAECIIRVTHTLPEGQQQLMLPHIGAIWAAIAEYEPRKGPQGLPALEDFDDYCRRTGGELLELLTALVCTASPAANRHRAALLNQAPVLGQGLQAVELLGRLPEDVGLEVCWLPRDLFERAGCPIVAGRRWWLGEGCRDGLDSLIVLARQRLQAGQGYALIIPRSEQGLRSFIAQGIARALLSLKHLHEADPFGPPAEVRPGARQARALASLGRHAAGHDWLLQTYFNLAGRGLPRSH